MKILKNITTSIMVMVMLLAPFLKRGKLLKFLILVVADQT